MSPNLSSGHFAKNKLIYEQVIYNTLTLVGLATTLSAAEARRYSQLHIAQCFIVTLLPSRRRLCNHRCLIVCLSACIRQQLCAKTSERTCMKFLGKIDNGPMNKPGIERVQAYTG